VVKVAETTEIKGIIAAWEVREMKFMAISRDGGVLVLQAVDNESPMEIPYPEGNMSKQIEEHLKREPENPVQLRIRSLVENNVPHIAGRPFTWNPSKICQLTWPDLESDLFGTSKGVWVILCCVE
jgi:hypothetical protein